MQTRKRKRDEKGFTIVEMLVAIFVFTIVMLVSSGAIFSILDANRKTRTIQLAIDNVDFALESMARTLRTGMSYHCDYSVTFPARDMPRDCFTGVDSIVFEEANGSITDPNDNYVYRLNTVTNRIERQKNTSTGFVPITAPDILLTYLSFTVWNTNPADGVQPVIIIRLEGRVGPAADPRKITTFNLETMVTQRLPDIP